MVAPDTVMAWTASADDALLLRTLAAATLLRLARTVGQAGSVDLRGAWASEFFALAREDIESVLLDHGLGLRADAEGVVVVRTTDGQALSAYDDLVSAEKDVCAPLSNMRIDYCGIAQRMAECVAQTVPAMCPDVAAACGGSADSIPSLDRARVVYSVQSKRATGEQISFECSWTMIPLRSGPELVLPDLARLPPQHRRHMLMMDGMGHDDDGAWGATCAQHALACFHVPCHELVHLLQTAAKQVDADRLSYSAEHDASRLCGVLMIQAMAGGRSIRVKEAGSASDAATASAASSSADDESATSPWVVPAYTPSLVVCSLIATAPLQAARLAEAPSLPSEREAVAIGWPPLRASGARLDSGAAASAADAAASGATAEELTRGGGVWAAYRAWTASFGLESPAKALRDAGCRNAHDRAMKDLVCVEALAGPGRRRDTAQRLLTIALAGRTGDVYSAQARERVRLAMAASPCLAVGDWSLGCLVSGRAPPAEAKGCPEGCCPRARGASEQASE